ncbi:glycosyltransferase, partial [Candidatus Dependentiae bacterium]|nr:glycosyltransferase [Candidatus Dependentiae bacterium]
MLSLLFFIQTPFFLYFLFFHDIINLYYDSHISIQVSKHEGLGLGFYEALATGTPVISLNTQ